MSSVNLPYVVRREVQKRVDAGDNFTAYDITLAVRATVGRSVNIDHQDINGIVRTLFLSNEMPDYKRELDYTLGASPAPYRYQPINAPAKAHSGCGGSTAPSKASLVSALQSGNGSTSRSSAPTSPSKPNRVSVSSNSNGELRVLKGTLAEAGLRPSQEVYATFLPSQRKLYITPTKVAMTSDRNAVSRKYRVDTNQNVRVSLNALGAGTYKSFVTKVNPSSGLIEIDCG